MQYFLSIVLSFVFAATCIAQSVTLPPEVRGVYGAWIPIKPIAVDGGKPKYRAEAPLQIINLADFFGPSAAESNNVIVQYTGVDSKGAPVLNARCKLEAWNAKGDVASDIATTYILIGNVPPGPIDPPVPPIDPPVPPPPVTITAPIPRAGFHVMILYETSAAMLPPQAEILQSAEVISYLNTKTSKDGLLPGWRAWDDDFTDAHMGNLAEYWKAGYKLAKSKQPADNTPMLVVSDGTKNVGEIVVLPPNKDAAMTIIKKYGDALSLAP